MFKKKTKKDIPDNYLVNCKNCSQPIMSTRLEENSYICPNCESQLRVSAKKRIEMICDKDSFKNLAKSSKFYNYLEFDGYDKKISDAQKDLKIDEAVIVGVAKIGGEPFCIGVMDSNFIMGSMGSVVGQKLTKMFEYATKNKLPVILYTASGGARMQEGIISLMQMAKVTQAVKRHSNAGLFYMPILTDPTTGGVTASFAMEGDIIAAEPNSLIAFAGPRVIKETIKTDLPEGFQTSEFLLEHGFLDLIIERKNQRNIIKKMISIHRMEK